jgi:hypothetical protein
MSGSRSRSIAGPFDAWLAEGGEKFMDSLSPWPAPTSLRAQPCPGSLSSKASGAGLSQKSAASDLASAEVEGVRISTSGDSGPSAGVLRIHSNGSRMPLRRHDRKISSRPTTLHRMRNFGDSEGHNDWCRLSNSSAVRISITDSRLCRFHLSSLFFTWRVLRLWLDSRMSCWGSLT